MARKVVVCLVMFIWIFTGLYPFGKFKVREARAATVTATAGTVVTASSGTCTADAWAFDATSLQVALSVNDDNEALITAASFDSPDISQRLRLSNFGFALPAGSTIDGVEVDIIRRSLSGNTGQDEIVQLIDAAGTQVGTDKGLDSTLWPSTKASQSYGGSADTWSASPTETMVEDVDFGLAICAQAATTNADVWIDYVNITLHYTSPAQPEFTQNDFEWFVDNDSEDPSDIWPSGSVDLAENAVLVSLPAHQAVASGSEVRIRTNITVGTANLGVGGQAFKIQYKAATDCTVLTGYTDVGASTSTTIWRFGNGPPDQTNLTTAKISTTTAAKQQSYVESNPTEVNPVAIDIGQTGEWDFNVKHNGATANTTYCFKIVKSDGTDLNTYNSDSFPKLDTAPNGTQIMRHGNFFLNESEKGFFWAD